MDALWAMLPEPQCVTDPIVKLVFIRMPVSTGFGDYTECVQVIPVRFEGQRGGFCALSRSRRIVLDGGVGNSVPDGRRFVDPSGSKDERPAKQLALDNI